MSDVMLAAIWFGTSATCFTLLFCLLDINERVPREEMFHVERRVQRRRYVKVADYTYQLVEDEGD